MEIKKYAFWRISQGIPSLKIELHKAASSWKAHRLRSSLVNRSDNIYVSAVRRSEDLMPTINILNINELQSILKKK
jgi:hypothetical protein